MNKIQQKMEIKVEKNTLDVGCEVESSKRDCSVTSNSFFDYDSLSKEELICRYLMEKKNKGQFLPYEYHTIIHRWVQETDCIDDLLLILDEIFSDSKHRNFSMKILNKKVLDKIKNTRK